MYNFIKGLRQLGPISVGKPTCVLCIPPLHAPSLPAGVSPSSGSRAGGEHWKRVTWGTMSRPSLDALWCGHLLGLTLPLVERCSTGDIWRPLSGPGSGPHLSAVLLLRSPWNLHPPLPRFPAPGRSLSGLLSQKIRWGSDPLTPRLAPFMLLRSKGPLLVQGPPRRCQGPPQPASLPGGWCGLVS